MTYPPQKMKLRIIPFNMSLQEINKKQLSSVHSSEHRAFINYDESAHDV